ncbi:MAG: pyrroloquinoline quinone biosynthesis protein PqqE, partial [Chloroflexi bacterium]
SLVAELTHRCPLGCVYCSNPLDLTPAAAELGTGAWLRVLREAEALGVVQVHFSGGEPLVRADLDDLVAAAADLGVYTNLITSGVGMDRDRARTLAERGLRSVQLSLQAARRGLADRIAGYRAHEEKRRAAAAVAGAGLPLSMNVVLHRLNIDDLGEIVDVCAAWGCERLELANTQFYGWALLNRERLLPSRPQLARAESVLARKRDELRGRMELIWVVPDYYERFPKPCMGGWGAIGLTVAPDGIVLPCPTARGIRGLRFERAGERELAWIWNDSDAFNRFRGTGWMPAPCRTCDRRLVDFGGCRCQAFALTGDAGRTDPVCHLSPDRELIDAALAGVDREAAAPVTPLEYRGRGRSSQVPR